MANGQVREYIGARYVPIFADPVQWDNEREYEPLTMVQYSGETYMSKQYVPIGVDLPDVAHGDEDNDFWVHMSNWNAQVEGYREEVLRYAEEVTTFDNRIDTLEDDLPTSSFDSTNTVKKAIDDAVALLPGTSFDTTNTVSKAISDMGDLLPASAFDSTNTVDARFDAIEANNWVETSRINNGAVTLDKINSDAKTYFTRPKIAVIGDSFSNENTEWPTIVANEMGKTLVNKATNGAGFTTGTKTFYMQLQELINNEDMSEFSHIILYGGVNDWNDAHSTVAAMNTAFSNFKTLYDSITGIKPKLVFAFGNVGKANVTAYNGGYYQWYCECMSKLKELNVPGIVDYVCFWHFGFNDVFASDNLHPNEKGEKVIASYMLKVLNGTYTGVHFRLQTNLSYPYTYVTFDNGIVTVGAQVVSINITAANTWIDFGSSYNFSSYPWQFGTDASQSETHFHSRYINYKTTFSNGYCSGMQFNNFMFNSKNGHFYLYAEGDLILNPVTVNGEITYQI